LGRPIPKLAVIEYGLTRWFDFEHATYNSEFYRAIVP